MLPAVSVFFLGHCMTKCCCPETIVVNVLAQELFLTCRSGVLVAFVFFLVKRVEMDVCKENNVKAVSALVLEKYVLAAAGYSRPNSNSFSSEIPLTKISRFSIVWIIR